MKTDVEAKKVEALLRRFENMVEQYDFDSVRSVCTSDFVLIERSYPTEFNDVEAVFRNMESEGITIQYDIRDMVVHIEENTAWATYTNEGTFSKPGDEPVCQIFVESVFLRKEDGEWRVVLMHVTYLPKPTE